MSRGSRPFRWLDLRPPLSAPPDVLGGRYQVVAPIGEGGMGVVVEAHDRLLRRRVAIKLLPKALESDAVARERLRGEALAAAALDHPFICKIHEIGESDGRPFIVMEYVDGETFQALARRTAVPLRQVVELATEMAEALDAAHRHGLVHRDLKPSNVMLTTQGHVKVMDFGLAKQIEGSRAHDSGTATGLTGSGTRIGTPAYMSPEQVLGGALDPRSDIFSLGVILHELATGRHPFHHDDSTQTMAAILRDAPMAGSRDLESLPGLGVVVTRMLAKACAERPQSMAELRVELEALRERARSSDSSRAAATLVEPALERTPFVGRDGERAELERMLDRMLTGQGGFALIGGEPGVGKTRLVREVMSTARQRGCLCLTGHCYEMEGAAPFVPFVESTEEAVRLVPQAVRAAMGDRAPEIASIVPSLRRTYSDIPAMPELPADQRRRLVFNAFLEYVRGASQKSPAVVLLDDLHWADESTLQLVLHVAPHLGGMRVFVVGTYRDVELDVKRPFAKALESLLRQRLAARIPLRRFDEAHVREMLSALAGSAPPSGLTRAVFRETEGNPFFVEEVYQHLDEEGLLFDTNRQWKADLRLGTIEVPEGVRLVVGRRVDRLGEQARKVLTAAAVIGRTFPLDALKAVVDAPEDDVLDAVEEAERAQLVTLEPGRRIVRYGFVHELIRTTLVSGLSLPRRQRLHLRIADALERQRTFSSETHASVLAHHLYQAGAAADLQRTANALALSGRAAIAAGAFEDALETFDNLIGLELADDDPLVVEAGEERAHALATLQRYDEAVASLERALTVHAARRDDAGIVRCVLWTAECFGWQGRFDEALEAQVRGLQLLSKDALRERARLLCLSALVRGSPAHIDTGFAHIQEALALAEQLEDAGLRGEALGSSSICQRMMGEYRGALESGRQALSLVPAHFPWARADVLMNLALCSYYLGDVDQCAEWLPDLATIATRTGHHGALWVHERCVNGLALACSGDLRAYVAASDHAVRGPHFRYVTRTQLGLSRLCLGDIDQGFEDLERVKSEQPAEHFLAGMPEANLFAASVLASRLDRAHAFISLLEPFLPRTGQRNVQGAFLTLEDSVIGLALLGDRARCGALYPRTLDDIKTGVKLVTLAVGPITPQLGAAIAADAAGLTDRSHEHFELAKREAKEIPFRLLQPAVLYWYGRSLAGLAGIAEAARGRSMVQASAADFRSLGMVLHAEWAERFLRGM